MARYRIEVKKSAVKELSQIPKKDLVKIVKKINSLADNPRPNGSKKLSREDKYRIRYGKYRILYLIKDDLLVIYVIKVAHRKDIYR
ncbi:MAG: type II toxin-antitoxin system RelE/ParE family toxin [Deltaproteobacteria bacterium]|jgi:mRNA interferase RelE/StbE|nr:type II toxin-antitoxin system RelE/ParE family toxin [Deltaproteobacteria bacterium]